MRRIISGNLFVVILFGLFGCHRMDVGAVMSKLRLGMNKTELDEVMKGEKFLKEQVVKARPGSSEAEERAVVVNHRKYLTVNPPNLIREQMPFNGSVRAYSYLVKERRPFANPIYIEALFVFVDANKGEVIGWADIGNLAEVRLWDEIF
jgi:hypothetical protein